MRRREDFRGKPLPRGGIDGPVGYESGECFLVQVLKLASAALAEMTARRLHMMRTENDPALRRHPIPRSRERHVAAARGNTVALCGDTQDFFMIAHEYAS